MLGYVFMAMGIVATVVFLTKRTVRVTTDVVAIKSIASMGFILSSVFFFVDNKACPDYLGAFTIGGACFGMLGDIVLDLKYSDLNDADRCTDLGFVAFLIGHIFYSIAMVSVYGIEPLNIICVVAGVIAGIVVTFLTEKVMKFQYGRFKKITLLYVSFLCVSLSLSGSYTLTEHYSLHSVLLNVGFLLFVISDAFLANIYFSPKEKDRTNRVSIVLNHATYYSAQYIIAMSLAFYRG